MIDIFAIIGIAIIATIFSIILKQTRPELAMCVAIAAGIIIFLKVSDIISVVLASVGELFSLTGTDFSYLPILLKIVGIAYITEFGSAICKDAGESAIAMKVSFAGKILILFVATPLMLSFVQMIAALLSKV